MYSYIYIGLLSPCMHVYQGRTQNLMCSFQEKVDLFDGVCTPSMQSMLKLGDLGASPQENFEK